MAGVKFGGGAIANPLQDERGTADEFDVAVDAANLQASAEFLKEGVDLCGVVPMAFRKW